MSTERGLVRVPEARCYAVSRSDRLRARHMASIRPIPYVQRTARRCRALLSGVSEPRAYATRRSSASADADRNPIDASGSRPTVSFNQVLSGARRTDVTEEPVAKASDRTLFVLRP